MSSETVTPVKPANHPAMFWTGTVITVLLTALFTMSAVFKLQQSEEMVKEFTEKVGYPKSSLVPIGVVEIVCVILYVIPQTSILGAILLTGYMGGAIATHVRLGELFIPQVIIGMMVWLGIYLREPRLRKIIFWRTKG